MKRFFFFLVEDLHNQYETLVPQRVSHIVFWKRYLFRKALLEDEESRRELKEKKERDQIEKVQWDTGKANYLFTR